MNTYTSAQFAQRIGVSVKTLQRWDREGRLHPSRTPGNRRIYTDEHLSRMLSSRRVAWVRPLRNAANVECETDSGDPSPVSPTRAVALTPAEEDEELAALEAQAARLVTLRQRKAARDAAAREARSLAIYQAFTRPMTPVEAATLGFVIQRLGANAARAHPMTPAEAVFCSACDFGARPSAAHPYHTMSDTVTWCLERRWFLAKLADAADTILAPFPTQLLAAEGYPQTHEGQRACGRVLAVRQREQDALAIHAARAAKVQPNVDGATKRDEMTTKRILSL